MGLPNINHLTDTLNPIHHPKNPKMSIFFEASLRHLVIPLPSIVVDELYRYKPSNSFPPWHKFTPIPEGITSLWIYEEGLINAITCRIVLNADREAIRFYQLSPTLPYQTMRVHYKFPQYLIPTVAPMWLICNYTLDSERIWWSRGRDSDGRVMLHVGLFVVVCEFVYGLFHFIYVRFPFATFHLSSDGHLTDLIHHSCDYSSIVSTLDFYWLLPRSFYAIGHWVVAYSFILFLLMMTHRLILVYIPSRYACTYPRLYLNFAFRLLPIHLRLKSDLAVPERYFARNTLTVPPPNLPALSRQTETLVNHQTKGRG